MDGAVVIVSCFGSCVQWMELLLLCHALVPVLDGWSCYCVMFWFQCWMDGVVIVSCFGSSKKKVSKVSLVPVFGGWSCC